MVASLSDVASMVPAAWAPLTKNLVANRFHITDICVAFPLYPYSYAIYSLFCSSSIRNPFIILPLFVCLLIFRTSLSFSSCLAGPLSLSSPRRTSYTYPRNICHPIYLFLSPFKRIIKLIGFFYHYYRRFVGGPAAKQFCFLF